MKKALVVRPGSLGDLIVTLPVFYTLKKNKYTVEVMGRKIHLDYLQKLNCLNNGIDFGNIEFLPLFSPDAQITEKIKKHIKSFDIIISYTGEKETFSKNLKRINPHSIIFDPNVDERAKIHISNHLLTPLKELFPVTLTQPGIHLKTEEKSLITIHPGSGSETKNWQKEYFLKVFKYFSKTKEVVIILGYAEEKQMKFWQNNVPAKNLILFPCFDALTEIMRKTYVYLGNDSGISHLFAASEIKTYVIFGPTNPEIWKPKGKNVTVFYKNTGCSPCSKEQRKSCIEKKCLEAISPDGIIAILDSALNS